MHVVLGFVFIILPFFCFFFIFFIFLVVVVVVVCRLFCILVF